MELIVKTLKGSHFEIRVQPNDTVMAAKKKIEDVQGKDNYPCGRQLLLYRGKMLKDETTLAENEVSEDGFLVVMLNKSKTLGSAGASSTQPASTNPPATAPTSNPTAPAAPAAPAEAPAAPAQAPIPLLPLDKAEEHEEKEKAKPVTYSYSFFHLIFSLAGMYSAMLLTGWSTSAGKSGKLVDVGWLPVWVRIITGWATAALYGWSLIAPILFPEKEF